MMSNFSAFMIAGRDLSAEEEKLRTTKKGRVLKPALMILETVKGFSERLNVYIFSQKGARYFIYFFSSSVLMSETKVIL